MREFFVWIVGEQNKGYLLVDFATKQPLPYKIGREKIHVIERDAYIDLKKKETRLIEAIKLSEKALNYYIKAMGVDVIKMYSGKEIRADVAKSALYTIKALKKWK